MHLVYFSHSYRKEDARIVEYFARLIRSEGFVPSLDPPSESVNSAKLERHLRSCDGMIAVLSSREGGVSKYILYEILICIKARKPLLVFVEDVLPENIISNRILQRRYSKFSFFREVREHRHALQILKTYLGESPPPKYQPAYTKRSCLVVGLSGLTKNNRRGITEYIGERGYSIFELDEVSSSLYQDLPIYEALTSADLALCYIDNESTWSHYLIGSIQAAFIPSLIFTANSSYPYSSNIPEEFQPKYIDPKNFGSIRQTISQEIDLFEEEFVEITDQKEVETYASLLVDVSYLQGNYKESTRDVFVRELVMGDKYTTGQAGVVGPQGHAHDINFNQIWNQSGSDIDLSSLADELSVLRGKLREEAAEAEHDVAVGEVAAAEVAAKKGDGPSVMEHLAKAGEWALQIAVKIGVPTAVEALQKSLGV